MKTQTKKLPKQIIAFLIDAQRNEITEEMIYNRLANLTKDKKNSQILKDIAKEEKRHHDIWKSYTGVFVNPNKFRVFFFVLVSRIF